MADLVQTAANVLLGTAPNTGQDENGIAGEAITAGEPVYLKSSDNKYYRAQSDGTPEESGANGLRIALNSAPGAGQPIRLFASGFINLGATLSIGQVYVVSANVGKIAPFGDLVTGNYVSVLGVAITAALMRTASSAAPFASGITKA